ncbi:MAG: TIGR02996 domain-containing protein [Kofleriaceae bacterium]
MKRNAELEAAILAAPDDLNSRMVYGDWLQAAGDPVGEWIAMRARLEMNPADVATRRAAIAVLAKKKKQLFGEGVGVLERAWIGWKGGFIDELRIQRSPATVAGTRTLEVLFAHPLMRYVRHVAFGELARSEDMQAAIAALGAARFPLLEEVLLGDQCDRGDRFMVDAITKLPIKRLTLGFVAIGAPMPQLEALTYLDQTIDATRPSKWILDGKGPKLTKVTIASGMHGATTDDEIEMMRARGIEVVVLRDPVIDNHYDQAAKSPIVALAFSGGREAVRHIPQAGMVLNNIDSDMISRKQASEKMFWLADIAATLPIGVKGYSAYNAAVVRQKADDHDEAELRAREGLIWSPNEPNWYSVLLDALRRSGRLAEAKKEIPRALRAIADQPEDAHADSDKWALVDAMLVLAQLGDHESAFHLAGTHPQLVDGMHRAVMAICLALQGDLVKAERQLALCDTKEPVAEHARAALAIRDGKVEEAKKQIAAAKRKRYGEMHWLAADPLLAPLLAKKK